MNEEFEQPVLPNLEAPSNARPGPSDAWIVSQVEAELGGQRANPSAAGLLAFTFCCAACVGVFGMLLGRAHPPSFAPDEAPVKPLSLAAQPTAVPVDVPAFVSWTYGFEDGQSRARASGKKMLVAFGAGWCSSCRWMESNVYTRPEVAGSAQEVEMVKVDTDARPDLARRYSIRALPSFVWMTAGGSETARSEGSLAGPQFAALMKANR